MRTVQGRMRKGNVGKNEPLTKVLGFTGEKKDAPLRRRRKKE